jgi:flagellar protein FliS
VVLLYEGAIRFCRLAQESMRAKDLEAQNSNLIRAQRIVGELLASLNRSAGGEVASNLARIYTYLIEELVKANLYDEPEKLGHVIKLLSEMHASWVEIDSTAGRDGKTGEPAPASDTAPRANPGTGGATQGGASVRTATNVGSASPAREDLAGAGRARLGDRLA